MFDEAQEAPDAVERQLRFNDAVVAEIVSRLAKLRPRAVVTIARGSSDNAATFAKYLIETRLGILTSSGAPSVSSVYSAGPDLKDALVLAISQSGRSPGLDRGTRQRQARRRFHARAGQCREFAAGRACRRGPAASCRP